MLSDDHRAVMTALKALVRPASLLEVSDRSGLSPFHTQACLKQLAARRMVAGLAGAPIRWSLTARGYADLYERVA